MNKNILWIIGLLLFSTISFASCSESSGEVDEYANWEQRNQNYVDSIAKVAKANEGNAPGQWKMLYSYKLPDLPLGTTGDVNDYVYCKIVKSGDGATPLATDTAYISYKGMLINGTIFDQSYKGEYNPDTAIPVSSVTGTYIAGFTTALMSMKAGDVWTLYIPSDLAYKSSTTTSGVPAYSTLIFDLALAKVAPLKGSE